MAISTIDPLFWTMQDIENKEGKTMAKDREYPCKYYIREKECGQGREGTFYGACQTCVLYCKKPGSKPARPDTRKEKTEKFNNDKRNWL